MRKVRGAGVRRSAAAFSGGRRWSLADGLVRRQVRAGPGRRERGAVDCSEGAGVATGSPRATLEAGERPRPAQRPTARSAAGAASLVAPSARDARRRAGGAGEPLGLGQGELPVQAEQRAQRRRICASSETSSQARLASKAANGSLRIPVSLPLRIASSTLARRRWRSSKAAMSPSAWSVMKAV